MGLHNRFQIGQWIVDRVEERDSLFDLGCFISKRDDGLLHPSTHMGCEVAMCHSFDTDISKRLETYEGLMPMLVGTLMHTFLTSAWESGDWEGIEARCEVPMGEGLPKGWQGSCDLLLGQYGDDKLTSPEWTVIDYKTVKGANIQYLDIDRPKYGYYVQASAYWHAANKMGYRMNPELCIVYVPVSTAPFKGFQRPIESWVRPMPQNEVFGEMKRRSRILKAYLAGDKDAPKKLEPEQVNKLNKKTGMIEVIEQQQWNASYCNSSQCQCKSERRVVAYLDKDEVL